MTKLLPYQRLLENMKGALPKNSVGYIPKEKAYEKLKKWSGVDFGYDIKAWEKWMKENSKR